jgi:head-tail adaptor
MKNQDKLCQKLQEALVLHGKGSLSPYLSQHLISCKDCQAFVQSEELLQSFKTELKSRSFKLDTAHDYEVRNAIVATSLRLQNAKTPYVWWKKPALLMMSFLMAFALFRGSWPMISELSIWDYQVQNQITQLLSEDAMSLAATENSKALTLRDVGAETNSYQMLKFASWALPSAESQKVFWTSDEELLQRSYWIWIRFLSEKSQQSYLKVKQLLDSYGDTKALRMLKLPLRKTVKDFEEYIKPFRLGPGDEAFEADVLILGVSLPHAWVRVDVLDEPLHLDPVLLNQMYPGKMLRMTIKQENSLYYVVAISETLLPSSLIEGKISSYQKEQLISSSFSDPLELNEKTFYRNITAEELSANTEDIYWLRVLFTDSKPYILSLTRRGLPFHQTLSSTIDRLSSYGFTLKDYPMHFSFSSPPDIFPSRYSLSEIANRKLWITVEGIQYDDQVQVTRIQVLENPLDPFPSENYLLASAPTEKGFSRSVENRESFQAPTLPAPASNDSAGTHSDYIVGATGHVLHLASGKNLTYAPSYLSPGSHIQWKGLASELSSAPELSLGRWSMVKSSYQVIKRYDNGVHVLKLKDHTKPVYLYVSGKIADEGILQAKTVEHDKLIIAVESRNFTLSHVLSIRGTVVQSMNKENSFLLDNGTMFIIDELSQIIHGPIWHGSTVVVKGAMVDQVFKAFIVEVESEDLIFTGLIVTIDYDAGLIYLDSGAGILINDKTIYSFAKNSLKVGSAVLIRARREGSRYIAVEILDARDHVSDKGANT